MFCEVGRILPLYRYGKKPTWVTLVLFLLGGRIRVPILVRRNKWLDGLLSPPLLHTGFLLAISDIDCVPGNPMKHLGNS